MRFEDDDTEYCDECEGEGVCPDCDGDGCGECEDQGTCQYCGGTGEA
jgi:hypothetical protein